MLRIGRIIILLQFFYNCKNLEYFYIFTSYDVDLKRNILLHIIQEAMYFLLDPMIRSELSQWQHTRIIKALLYQGHHKMALKYMRIKKPAMLTAEDVKLRLTVLLANGSVETKFYALVTYFSCWHGVKPPYTHLALVTQQSEKYLISVGNRLPNPNLKAQIYFPDLYWIYSMTLLSVLIILFPCNSG